MKTTKKQFELFKSECKYWVKKFELSEWDIMYDWVELNNNNAQAELDGDSYKVTVALSKDVENMSVPINELIKRLAKHEMIHILLGKYSYLNSQRYVSKVEESSCLESTVIKLEKLL